jgi:HK97 family phage prohead protease
VNDFTRSFPLEDITIRSGGDGRTVEAYAAVFGPDVPISDNDGRYRERIDPSAFNKTIADKGTRFSVLYNHGMTIYGTPSDSGSMPIGTPLEVRADTRGLLTVTRYNKTPLGEATLEAISSGSLRSQSFQGSFVRSDKPKPRGGYRANAAGEFPMVTRQEINLKEYGPTPFPAYDQAAIVGVRAGLTISETDSMLLSLILENLAEGDAALDPFVNALCKTSASLDQAQLVIAQILGAPNPDLAGMADGPERSLFLTRLNLLATRLADAPAPTATPSGAGTDEPLTHSGRLSLSKRTREILAASHPEGRST